MRFTFVLKEPNKDKETLILFSSYFRNEGKKFIYSTGERIHPNDWDFERRQPKHLNGRTSKAQTMRDINAQIDRYHQFFTLTINTLKLSRREPLIADIRESFDQEFKRTKAISNNFFEVYDLFLAMKEADNSETANSKTTKDRYRYTKKLFEEFQTERKKKIHFNQINQSFYNDFLGFCIQIKSHSANTLKRNVGLFKTFMYWAFENHHTYKIDFQKFKAPKGEETQEVALSLDQVKEAFEFDFSKDKRLERTRDLFVFGCVTGMRFSNYSKVRKEDITNGFIKVRDKKNSEKLLEVPLNDFSKNILKKYDHRLPQLSNQKFNEYIKEVFQKLGYNELITKSMRIGSEYIETINPLHERISSHTARRTFITIMKNQKVPDKTIMDITGHKSLAVFNNYYKPNRDDKKDFVQSVFNLNS